MFVGVVLTALFASAIAWNPKDCGTLGSAITNVYHSKRKVIGGVHLNAIDTPWILRIDGPNGFICTGTMISNRHFLSAGHCFSEKINSSKVCKVDNQKFTACLFLNTNKEKCPKKLQIAAIHNLDEYVGSKCDRKKDFVIGELTEDITAPGFVPICLPTKENGMSKSPAYHKEFVYNSGYSRNQEAKNGTQKNTYLNFVMAGHPIPCKKDKKEYICTRQHSGAAICKGDSGGPMIIIRNKKAILVGVNVAAKGICNFNQLTNNKPYDQIANIVKKFKVLLNKYLGSVGYTF